MVLTLNNEYISAIDQGATGIRFIFNYLGSRIGSAYETHEQHCPEPNWVEHGSIEMWELTKVVIESVLSEIDVTADKLAGIGMTNQREMTVLWD